MSLARVVLPYFLIVMTTPAGAQPVGSQADALFRVGRDLMAAGKIAEACAAFEQSQKRDPAVTTLINLAACRERLGQLATAWELFLTAERQTQSASNGATAQLHKIALDRAAKLEPRVPKLTIHISDQSKLDGLEILRDGERVADVMWNHALPIDGGTYTITARAPGIDEWSTRVALDSESDTKTVDIPNLRNLKRIVEPKPTPPIGANSTRRRWAVWKPWAIVAAGGSIMAGSGLLHRFAYQNFKEFDKRFSQLPCWGASGPYQRGCTPSQIPPDLNHRLTLARQQQTLAVSGYITASSLLAAGVVLWYLNRPLSQEHGAPNSPTGRITAVPMMSSNTLGILVTLSH